MTDTLTRLPDWIAPFSVTMSPEILSHRRQIVESFASAENLDTYQLVAAAHNQLGPDTLSLLTELARQSDPSVVFAGSEALASTLAAAAVAVRLSIDEDSILTAFLVDSAGFLGLEPAIADLPALAASTLATANRRARARFEPEETPRAIKALLNGATTQVTEGTDFASVMKVASSRDSALNALARRVEDVVESLESRLALLDEELDLLWWSRRASSTTDGVAWSDIEPPRRAALAAAEIAAHLAYAPAPQGARSLILVALGDDAGVATSIASVAMHLPLLDSNVALQRLLPLTSYRMLAESVGDDLVAVEGAMVRTGLGVPEKLSRPLVEIAEQALREIQIATLL